MIVHLKKSIPIEVLRFPVEVTGGKPDIYTMKARGFIGELIDQSGNRVINLDVKKVLREWSDGSYDEVSPANVPCHMRFNMDEVTAVEG